MTQRILCTWAALLTLASVGQAQWNPYDPYGGTGPPLGSRGYTGPGIPTGNPWGQPPFPHSVRFEQNPAMKHTPGLPNFRERQKDRDDQNFSRNLSSFSHSGARALSHTPVSIPRSSVSRAGKGLGLLLILPFLAVFQLIKWLFERLTQESYTPAMVDAAPSDDYGQG